MANPTKFELGEVVEVAQPISMPEGTIPPGTECEIVDANSDSGSYDILLVVDGKRKQVPVAESDLRRPEIDENTKVYRKDDVTYQLEVWPVHGSYDCNWTCSYGHTGAVKNKPTKLEAIKAAIQHLQGHHFLNHTKTQVPDR